MLCIRKEEIKEVKSFFRKSNRRVSRYKSATLPSMPRFTSLPRTTSMPRFYVFTM